jgi:hypothetical protein
MTIIEKPILEHYENRLVAFVDLLGFKKLVEDADGGGAESFAQLADLLGFMKQVETDVRQKQTHFKEVMDSLEATAISDSLIISVKFDPEQPQAILGFLYYLKSLQVRLVGDHKMLVRGYVCLGKLYHHDNILFGVPYMKAYCSEKKVCDPKIAIDPELEAIVQQADSETQYTDEKELVRRDEDGSNFINYLQDPNLPAGNTSPYSYLLPEITEWAWQQLRTQRGEVLEKYSWLRGYIDLLIRENKCPDAEVATQAFSQKYSLTKTLSQYAGRKVYFHRAGDHPCPEYWDLLDNEFAGATVISSATVPVDTLDESYDIRPGKLSAVKSFLIELGAYSSEADKIICSKSKREKRGQ